MLKNKFIKIVTALACIVTLILPHTSVVLAAALTNEDPNEVNEVTLKDIRYHENGTAIAAVDTAADATTYVLKIYDKNDEGNEDGYQNAFYCLDVTKSFPSGLNGTDTSGITYTRTTPDFFSSNTTVLTDAKYYSLSWLLKNMYLYKQMSSSDKTALFNKAFSNMMEEGNSEYDDTVTVSDIINLVDDDAIEVVQQWAIWYFTNRDDNTIQGIPILNTDTTTSKATLPLMKQQTVEESSLDNMNTTKLKWMNVLYQYFVTEAEKHTTSEEETHPSLTGSNAKIVEDGDNYKAGPFKITVPTGNTDTIALTITNASNSDVTNYTTDGNSSKDIPTNTDFYIYTPKTDGITELNLNLTYYETKASKWTAKNDTTDKYQPMVLITKEPNKTTVNAKLEETKPDLALRKYIVQVKGKDVENSREPKIVVKDGKIEYQHRKDAVSITEGDLVTYEIVGYNEGDVKGNVTLIADYLPEGLEFVADNETNKKYGWKPDENDSKKYTTDYTKNMELAAFDSTNNKISSTEPIQIVCRVTSTTSGAVLTNIAEIAEDNIDDIDSQPGNNSNRSKTGTDRANYRGNTKNPEDLSKTDYYYEGEQDDDDFEKVIVEGKAFDLSLQKFVTKVNGTAVSPSREPKYDTTPLKNNGTNATFTQTKNAVLVQNGDIVTYTIRVYNEGEVDGYAEQVTDFIPSGLGYLVNYKGNINNAWSVPDDSTVNKVSKLTTSQQKNLKLEDFEGITSLSDASVVAGTAGVKLISTALSSSNTQNLIAAFDGSDKLNYKDIEVTCIVLDDTNLKNIAEFAKHSDKDKNTDIKDRDSIPGTVKPDNYPGDDKDQDDHDYEILITKKFDLALQKFITGVNDKQITDRAPVATYANGKITYKHPETALEVKNGDLITYTIRVYNEGEMSGYAAEIGDDIPDGLEFDASNSVNKTYGWVMYDASGKETQDASQAKSIRTTYLSLEKNKDKILNAFDAEKGTIDSQDVQAVFKVTAKSTNATIINTAEITKDTDPDGKEVEDIDSVPDNNKDGEDDIDKERIHVGYFDLALQKDLTKAIVTEGNATQEIPAVNGQLMKVEIHRNKINSTIVKFVYTITIKNEGTIPGFATEITDYVPNGLQFVESDNTGWTSKSDGVITTNNLAKTLIQPGETAKVDVVLRWINGESNLGLKTNIAEISQDYNEAGDVDDIDSTPNNKKDGEDDIDNAEVILSISTGRAPVYFILSTTVLVIIGTGVAMIKKYVL